MNRFSNSSVALVLALSFGSLGAVGCATPTEAPDAVGGSEIAAAHDVANDGIAASLAGESGSQPGRSHTTGFVGKALTGSAAKIAATLEVEVPAAISGKAGVTEKYDVYTYDFGVDDGSPTNIGGTADVNSNKVAIRPLSIVVKPQANASALRKAVFVGGAFPKMVLSRPGASGKGPVPFAVFEAAFVSVVNTNAASESVLEEYVVQAGAITLTHEDANVKIDQMKGTVACKAPCPCGTAQGAGALGPYVQADAGTPIDPKATRVDYIKVALHSDFDIGSTYGGAAAAKAVLDGIEIARDVEKGGVCAAYYTAIGAHVRTLKLGVAAPSTTGKSAGESTSWDACYASVDHVHFTSSGDAPVETIGFSAFGLIRTDRQLQPVASQSTVGWSFVDNQPAASCAEVSQL